MPPGKLRVAVRFSVTSNTSSRIKGTSKENRLIVALKVNVTGPTGV